jgi:hypothetical protein
MNNLMTKLARPGAARSFGRIMVGVAVAATMAFGIASADNHPMNAKPDKTCSHSGPCLTGSNSGSGIGVYGSANNNYGVYGQGLSNLAGVGGFNSSTGDGVYGQSTKGNGVEGSSTNNYGIRGNGGSGIAGVGGFNSSTGAGVYGYSTSGPGIVGYSAASYGVWAQAASSLPALLVQGGTTQEGFWAALLEDSRGNFLLGAEDTGNLEIAGLLYTNGSCHYGCSRTRHVARYGATTSVPTIDDVGEATLRDGRASVALDPAFANTIDGAQPYLVLVTPEGDSDGLYVAGKTRRGFEVRENRGGHATIAFSYRIVAHPFGAPAERLPFVDEPTKAARFSGRSPLH